MRRVLRIADDGMLYSDLRSDLEPLAVQIGMCVTFTRAVELAPYGIIEKGCKCWVSWVDATTGQTEITAEGCEPALHWWDNRIMLMPYDTDDLASALRIVVHKRTTKVPRACDWVPRAEHVTQMCCIAILAFLVGCVAAPAAHALVTDVVTSMSLAQPGDG